MDGAHAEALNNTDGTFLGNSLQYSKVVRDTVPLPVPATVLSCNNLQTNFSSFSEIFFYRFGFFFGHFRKGGGSAASY